MKKFFVAATVAVGVMMSACGGGSANCDAMKKQCDACTGTAGAASGKASCNTALNTYTLVGGTAGDASCKAVVDAKTYDAAGAACK
jgi:hypothetical protein